jgi:hypothetical protein
MLAPNGKAISALIQHSGYLDVSNWTLAIRVPPFLKTETIAIFFYTGCKAISAEVICALLHDASQKAEAP